MMVQALNLILLTATEVRDGVARLFTEAAADIAAPPPPKNAPTHPKQMADG
jgi:hypothetical protein